MISSVPERISLDDAAETLTALAGLLEKFLRCWDECDGRTPPELGPFLPESGDLRQIALSELIKIDLEYRWLRHNFPRRIEEYVDEFPELAAEGIPVDLIYEEFHVRKQSGLNVDPIDFINRFPRQAEDLRRLLGVTSTHETTSLARGISNKDVHEFAPGQQIDDFDLMARLGRGAFASVFLARQRSMQRMVALKVSADHGTEPQTLAQLDHDHIVRVFDLRSLPERKLRLLYMQYLPGGTLQQVIEELRMTYPQDRNGRVLLRAIDKSLADRGETPPAAGESPLRDRLAAATWPEAVCWLGSRLAEALEYAHHRGVLHRDVKPANVLLTATGTPKLADFNVSFGSGVTGATPEAFFGGSLAYMSPEQIEAFCHIRRPDTLDGRADVYSLGVMLWELLTGYRPFIDEQFQNNWNRTLETMLERRRRGVTQEVLESLPRNCPPGVARVLTKCLDPKVETRWQNGAEFARQLDVCGEVKAEALIYPSTRSVRMRLRPYAVLMVLLLALIPNAFAGVFNFLYNRKQIEGEPKHKAIFQPVQLTINAIAYPVGLVILGYLSHTVAQGLRRSESDGSTDLEQWKSLCSRALYLGQASALLGVIEWSICGILYPIVLHLRSGVAPPYEQFMASLLLCGLIAASYPFFMVTYYSVRCLLPPLLPNAPIGTVRHSALDRVSQLAWVYLLTAAAVPLLGVVILTVLMSVSGQPDPMKIRALGVLGVGGLAGLLLLYPLFRRVQNDLATLRTLAPAEK